MAFLSVDESSSFFRVSLAFCSLRPIDMKIDTASAISLPAHTPVYTSSSPAEGVDSDLYDHDFSNQICFHASFHQSSVRLQSVDTQLHQSSQKQLEGKPKPATLASCRKRGGGDAELERPWHRHNKYIYIYNTSMYYVYGLWCSSPEVSFFFWRLYLGFIIHKLGSFVIRAYIYILQIKSLYKLKMFYLLSYLLKV